MINDITLVGSSLSEYLSWENIENAKILLATIGSKIVPIVKKKYSEHKVISGAIQFNSDEDFWKSVLGGAFYNKSGENVSRIRNGQVVKLTDFTISEWIPWSPGRYWTKHGKEMRTKAFDKENIEEISDKLTVLTPTGKTHGTLGGLGTLRFNEIKIDNKKYKLLSATSSETINGGIPLIMDSDIYENTLDRIREGTTFQANIIGKYLPISRKLTTLISHLKPVPKYCVWVDNKVGIKNPCKYLKDGKTVYMTPWTIFRHKADDEINYSFDSCFVSNVDCSNEDLVNTASTWIEDEYVKKHSGKIITEFDEIVSRFSITEIKLTDVILGKHADFRRTIDNLLDIKDRAERDERLKEELNKEFNKWDINLYA